MKIIKDKTGRRKKRVRKWADEVICGLIRWKPKCACGLKFKPNIDEIQYNMCNNYVFGTRCRCGKVVGITPNFGWGLFSCGYSTMFANWNDVFGLARAMLSHGIEISECGRKWQFKNKEEL